MESCAGPGLSGPSASYTVATMVPFEAIPRVVSDAARLVTKGEVLVSGSAALAWWVESGKPSRFVELAVGPPEAAQRVEKMMGLDAWYDRQFGVFVIVIPRDGFLGPTGWATRARRFKLPEAPAVEVLVPEPHDVVLAKLERFDATDQAQIRAVLQALPMNENQLDALADTMPHRLPGFDEARRGRFDFNVTRLRPMLYT